MANHIYGILENGKSWLPGTLETSDSQLTGTLETDGDELQNALKKTVCIRAMQASFSQPFFGGATPQCPKHLGVVLEIQWNGYKIETDTALGPE